MESIAVKAWVVSRDFKETWERATLNYWHTFGHALEVLFTPPLNHGVSVWYWIIFANFLSNQLGISSQSFWEKINKELIKKLQTQKLDSVIFNSSEKVTSFLMKKMRNDKKNIGNDINFILPANFWKFIKTSITETELRICIKEYFNYLEKNKLLV
jgi:3-dehydroquinate synthase